MLEQLVWLLVDLVVSRCLFKDFGQSIPESVIGHVLVSK